jgi:hypothetical protein
VKITEEQAAARVRAVLGRPARDALEATIALEAWGGLTPRTALRLAPHAVASGTEPANSVRLQVPSGGATRQSYREVLGLIATLLATTAWVAPMAGALGSDATVAAWQIALPISIGLQWLLRRRHLTGADGIGRLRADQPVLVSMALLAVTVLAWLLVAPASALPGALMVTWVGGLLIVVRGWGIPYALALLAAIWALEAGLPLVTDIILVVSVTAFGVTAALLTSPPASGRPTPWRRSLPAGAIGGLTALLIIIDPAVEWSSMRPFPVFALVPALLGTLWAGTHLNRIWTVLVSSLASTSLVQRSTSGNRRVFTGIVLGAVGRLLLGTTLASFAVFLVMQGANTNEGELIRLLIGLGAFGVVGFLAALLESFSMVRAGLVLAVAALAAAAFSLSGLVSAPQGSTLVVAAAAAVIVSLVPLRSLVRNPDRTLATMI